MTMNFRHGSLLGWLRRSRNLQQMFDDNVEVVIDDPTSTRQRAWAALGKVARRVDGTAAMPKGWPCDYDDAAKAGAGARLHVK